MNEDVLSSQWYQMRDQLKMWWSKLTESDLDQIDGERERLIGKLQEKYGYTRDKAMSEIERHLKAVKQTAQVR